MFFRRDKKGVDMYRSALLESLWPHGFSSIIAANINTFGYITKDMQKNISQEIAKKTPPFLRMSLKPGIGLDGWSRSLSDGLLHFDGRTVPLPRYFRKVAERDHMPGYVEMLRRNAHFREASVLTAEDWREKLRNYVRKVNYLLTISNKS